MLLAAWIEIKCWKEDMWVCDEWCRKCPACTGEEYHTSVLSEIQMQGRHVGSLCFGGEQEGLKASNPCVDKHCPLLISLKQLAWTVTTTARDPPSNMIAVRGINPKILEKGKLPDWIRLKSLQLCVCVCVCVCVRERMCVGVCVYIVNIKVVLLQQSPRITSLPVFRHNFFHCASAASEATFTWTV